MKRRKNPKDLVTMSSKHLCESLESTLEGLKDMCAEDERATVALDRALAVLRDAVWDNTAPNEELRRRDPPKKHLSVRASPSFKEMSEKDEYDETCGRLTLVIDEEEWAAVRAEVNSQLDGTGNLAYIEMIADMEIRASVNPRDEVGVERSDVDLCAAVEELVEKAEIPPFKGKQA